jgi:hypothetical protein
MKYKNRKNKEREPLLYIGSGWEYKWGYSFVINVEKIVKAVKAGGDINGKIRFLGFFEHNKEGRNSPDLTLARNFIEGESLEDYLSKKNHNKEHPWKRVRGKEDDDEPDEDDEDEPDEDDNEWEEID